MFLIYITSKLEKTPQSTTDDFLLRSQDLRSVKVYGVQGREGPTGGASLDFTVMVLAAKAISLKLCTAYASEPGVSCNRHQYAIEIKQRISCRTLSLLALSLIMESSTCQVAIDSCGDWTSLRLMDLLLPSNQQRTVISLR